jgi:hypothetical protein
MSVGLGVQLRNFNKEFPPTFGVEIFLGFQLLSIWKIVMLTEKKVLHEILMFNKKVLNESCNIE